jgi:hypothetical protein
MMEMRMQGHLEYPLGEEKEVSAQKTFATMTKIPHPEQKTLKILLLVSRVAPWILSVHLDKARRPSGQLEVLKYCTEMKMPRGKQRHHGARKGPSNPVLNLLVYLDTARALAIVPPVALQYCTEKEMPRRKQRHQEVPRRPSNLAWNLSVHLEKA